MAAKKRRTRVTAPAETAVAEADPALMALAVHRSVRMARGPGGELVAVKRNGAG